MRFTHTQRRRYRAEHLPPRLPRAPSPPRTPYRSDLSRCTRESCSAWCRTSRRCGSLITNQFTTAPKRGVLAVPHVHEGAELLGLAPRTSYDPAVAPATGAVVGVAPPAHAIPLPALDLPDRAEHAPSWHNLATSIFRWLAPPRVSPPKSHAGRTHCIHQKTQFVRLCSRPLVV